MSKKKLLIVSKHFPPNGQAGTHRVLRFIKYLTGLGWDICVLTLKPEFGLDKNARDASLLEKIPVSVRVYRTAALRLFWPFSGLNSYLIPDREAGWIPIAFYKALRIIKEEGHPILYSSAPPWTDHVIAALLKKKTGIRWVADIRDPWTRRPWMPAENRRGVRYALLKRIERAVVHSADRVVLNTEPLCSDFCSYYHNIEQEKFVTITNGIDADDFRGLNGSSGPRAGRFVITHGGSLYRKRDPRPFLTAVAELVKEKVISENELLVRFVGSVDPKFDLQGWVRELHLEAVVRIEPPVSHPKYLELLSSSDLLLAIQPDTDLQVPSKLFEYIAVGKRILALAHDGATRNVVEQYRRGRVVDPYNVAEMKKTLLEYVKGEPLLDNIQVESPDSLRFSMANLSKELDRVLTECLAE